MNVDSTSVFGLQLLACCVAGLMLSASGFSQEAEVPKHPDDVPAVEQEEDPGKNEDEIDLRAQNAAIRAAAARAAAGPRLTIGQRLEEQYYYMTGAAKMDAGNYRKMVVKLEEVARKLSQSTKLSAKDKQKLALYKEAHRLYGELTQLHDGIATAFADKTKSPSFQDAWEKIPELEKNLQKITKKEVVRTWVTPGEIAKLQAAGSKRIYKGRPTRYPFLREHWMNKEEYQKMQLKKAAEARKRAATAAEKKR